MHKNFLIKVNKITRIKRNKGELNKKRECNNLDCIS